MKDRIEFKAYKGPNMVAHTWALRGTHAETMEREMYQKLLQDGHYTRVDCTRPGKVWEPLL